MRASEKAKVVSFEDLEVFQRAYRVSLEVHRVEPGACRRSNSTRWAIRCGGRANPSARILPKAMVARSSRRPSSSAFWRWRSVRADEMRVWARYALDLGYLDEPTWRSWRDEYQIIARHAASSGGAVVEVYPFSVLCLSVLRMVAERSVCLMKGQP